MHTCSFGWKTVPEGALFPSGVDDYVTAEFIDAPAPTATGEVADQQRLMLRLQIDLMVHRHNEDSNCMVDGRCKRFFPKQFSERTILNVHAFPSY